MEKCPICNGSIQTDPKQTPDRHKDCCPARHKMLYDQGFANGLTDKNSIMWSPQHPKGAR